MLGRERFHAALSFREADRVPLYVWVFGQPGVSDEINATYGSFDAFADALDLDLVQAFPAWSLFTADTKRVATGGYDPTYGQVLTVDEALACPLSDPDDAGLYEPIRRAVEHDQGRRGRAVLVQTPGVFEASNSFLGLQDGLIALALEPEKCRAFYERIADWSCRYIDHCADLGVDCIHVSDDWGGQSSLLFRPEIWERCVRPPTQRIVDRAKLHGLWCSLHSDGNITSVLDGVADLGFNLVHPVQESAGVDPAWVKSHYRGRLALYGGLDVQSVLGRLPLPAVEDEVRRVLRALKADGGYVFCTSHMVQPGTPLSDVVRAYEVAREEAIY